MFILDTNAVSDLLKGTAKVVARFEAVPDDAPVVTTTVTRFEILMKGRYQAILTAADRDQLLTAVARLVADEERLAAFDILPISEPVADHFERLLKVKGLKKIGRADLLIACIALAHDATLVTRNTKGFRPIPNLKQDNWAD